MAKIGIIGGGAAGMMAALAASEGKNEVTILERKDRLGKKILVTGNGRCNFSNAKMGSNFYYCDDDGFVEASLSKFGNVDSVLFFEKLGVLTKNKNGYLYPLSEQASTILEAFEYAIREQNIDVKLNTDVVSLKKENEKYVVTISTGEIFIFDKMIVSTGGKSSLPKNEKCNGYNLLKSMGHSYTQLYPALTSLKCEGLDFKKISGVRQDCKLSLVIDGDTVMEDFGEVLFNDNGISGIVTFQISHCAIENAREEKSVKVLIDLLPGISEKDLDSFLDLKLLTHNEITCQDFITGFVNKKIGLLLLDRKNISYEDIVGCVSSEIIKECIYSMKNIEVIVKGDASFDKSQVTGGGIPLYEINDSFESNFNEGLYIIGELLNVDGICGGYNLQWAFTSGYIAGTSAAK